jgi:hypothetical protein
MKYQYDTEATSVTMGAVTTRKRVRFGKLEPDGREP